MMVLALVTGCQKKSSSAPVSPNGPGTKEAGKNNPPPDNKDGQQTPSEAAKEGDGKRTRGNSLTVGDRTIEPKDVQVTERDLPGGGGGNAVHGDYLWDPPGLPYPVADSPILTGAQTEREYQATDANDDHLMSYLRDLADKQIELDKEFGENSLKLAKAISGIEASVGDIRRDTSHINIRFKIKSGEREYIIPFEGRMTANRRAELDNVRASTTYEEIDRKREQQYKERKFRLKMMCVDKTTGCQSIIMRLDQFFLKPGVERSKAKETDWQICRSVYALQRLGNVHLQIDENDYINYKSYTNANQRKFVELLANSAHYVRYVTKSLQPLDRRKAQRPRLHRANIEFFAVAYGFAGFQLNLEAARSMNGANVKGSNITKLRGPMLYAPSRIANDNEMGIFSSYVDEYEYDYAAMISSALLVENDGRGQMAIVLNFKGAAYGAEEPATQVNFTTLFAETVNPFEQREKYISSGKDPKKEGVEGFINVPQLPLHEKDF